MFNKYLKLSAAVLMSIMAVLLLAACGEAAISRPQPKVDAVMVKVSGSCDIAVSNGIITVSGQTNIEKGALIHVSVVSQSGAVIDYQLITKDSDEIKCDFEKTQEKYGDISQITGYITFAPVRYGKQPEEIYNIYGEKFENIEFEKESVVWDNKGIIVLFASETMALK